MKTKLHSRLRGNSSGQSIVELALCMPLLMLILLGTVDVGRVFFDYIQMRNAVVEGATYGTRHPTDTLGIQTAAFENNIPGDTAITATISGNCTQPQGGGSVTVEADHLFTPVLFATLSSVAPSVDWSFNVHASSKMRCMT